MIGAGFDPGYAHAGIAVVERQGSTLKLLHWKNIETKPKQSAVEREDIIWRALSEPIRQFHPVILGMENQLQVAVASRMRAKNNPKGSQTSGFNANNDKVIEIVGLAKGCCRAYGVRRELFQPATIKLAVCGKGSGSAGKGQIIEAVCRLFPELRDAKITEHVADAIATAILACRVALSEA